MAKCKKCLIGELEKCDTCGDVILDPYKKPWQFDKIGYGGSDFSCMHENCPGCGGVHMISCPCPRCSPRM